MGIMLLASVLMGQVFAEPSFATETLDLKIDDTDGACVESDSIQPAKYSFASAQGASSLQVIPGGEARGVIYFYDVDGNRITHITLEVVQAPDSWEVEIAPPLHDTEVKFGGQIITVTENLYAEPSELLAEEIQDVPEGMVCLTLPNRGYALAKAATISVRVPQSDEVGTKGEIKIAAVASWLGQTGAIISQGRDFDFTVKIIYEH